MRLQYQKQIKKYYYDNIRQIMIENLTNILRLAYFSQKTGNKTNNHNTKKYRNRHGKQKNNSVLDSNLIQLKNLIISEQPIERWYIQFELRKQNYYIKKIVYDSIMNNTITIHNLFLMLIQFQVFDSTVWLPLEKLCALKGGRQNQLCCLIHYSVTNLQGSFGENPKGRWSKKKAQQEMGQNFTECYNKQISLSQKIAILPMLILLSTKNSDVLWQKLLWIKNLGFDLINSIESNLRFLLQQEISHNFQPDQFTEKLYTKSLQLCEVQGFVSAQNLFSVAYELYGISQVLQLLKLYRPYGQEECEEYKVILKNFITELLENFKEFQFDITKQKNDFMNIIKIVIENKLYLEQLTDKDFLNQYVEEILVCYSINHKMYRKETKTSLVLRIARSLSGNHRNQDLIFEKSNFQSNKQIYKELINDTPEHIITNFLHQFYLLRPEYLEALSLILRDCHQIIKSNLDELWSQSSSWFCRLQLYLLKNYVPEFLIDNFMALQTRQIDNIILVSQSRMIYFYDVVAFILKGNPIAYGHLDRIILQIREDEREQNNNSQEKTKRQTNLLRFLRSFLQKIVVSRDSIMHIIGDQLQWKENIEENYPNANYQSLFISEIFSNQAQWLFHVVTCICLIKISIQIENHKQSVKKYEEYYLTKGPTSKQPAISRLKLDEFEYFKWVTLLLMLYYYFNEVQRNNQVSKLSNMDKLLHKQKFLQKLYPIKYYKKFSQFQQNRKFHPIQALDLLIIKLDDWQLYYSSHSKTAFIQYGLSYPITKMVKNKLKKKIVNFIRRKDFEENQLMPEMRY